VRLGRGTGITRDRHGGNMGVHGALQISTDWALGQLTWSWAVLWRGRACLTFFLLFNIFQQNPKLQV
jgi:hypothetical protein